VAKRKAAGFGLMIAVGAMATAPAGAVKDLSDNGSLPTANVVVYGSTHAVDDMSVKTRFAKGPRSADAVSPVPEPANWLMMLIGFGLLGAMSRRSEMDRFRDEMVV